MNRTEQRAKYILDGNETRSYNTCFKHFSRRYIQCQLQRWTTTLQGIIKFGRANLPYTPGGSFAPDYGWSRLS